MQRPSSMNHARVVGVLFIIYDVGVATMPPDPAKPQTGRAV
jgi:hypothetical protein